MVRHFARYRAKRRRPRALVVGLANAKAPAELPVRFDFRALGIAQVVQLIYSEALPGSYVIDPEVVKDERAVYCRPLKLLQQKIVVDLTHRPSRFLEASPAFAGLKCCNFNTAMGRYRHPIKKTPAECLRINK